VSTLALPDGRAAAWITESAEPAPSDLLPADDRLRAADALRHVRAGGAWLWVGDHRNGLHLLDAMERRILRQRPAPTGDLAARWRQHRAASGELATLLGRVIVAIEPDGSLALPRAPDTREAFALAWPERLGSPAAVGLRTLVGALAAAGWTRAGLQVPGLSGTLRARYGVFPPTRNAYVGLLDALGDPSGLSVLDVGCGTGVLGFVLLQRGAALAVGTDLEPRAVACARDNARALGLAARYAAIEADLLPPPPEAFDLIVCNPPWLPEAPRTRLDRAVFDGDGFIDRLLSAAPGRLRPQGRIALLVSDLPERLGLRPPGSIDDAIARAGLTVVAHEDRPATHRRARDPSDPLHAARSEERVGVWSVRPTG
jgi:SAM-dependent methyltransferase